MNDQGHLLSLAELHSKGLKSNHLKHETLRFYIKTTHRNILESTKDLDPNIPILLSIMGLSIKGCLTTYEFLMEHNSKMLADIQRKWAQELNEGIEWFYNGF